MISRKTAISIVIGSAVGGIAFLIEPVLVAVLPPFTGVRRWWILLPNVIWLLITLGMGIACGLVVHVFTRFPKRIVLVSAICSYNIINIAIAVWLTIAVWLANILPEGVLCSWLISSACVTLADVVAFSIGAIVSYIALGKHLLRRGQGEFTR